MLFFDHKRQKPENQALNIFLKKIDFFFKKFTECCSTLVFKARNDSSSLVSRFWITP